MSNKNRGMLVVFIFVISTLLISACTQSLSEAPAATPTLIPTGLFISPFPSAENPMAMIEEFAKQTAAAQTTIAGGGTPGTAQALTTGTVITPQTSGSATVTPTPTLGTPVTPTNAIATTAVVVLTVSTPGGPTTTPFPPGVRPSSYTLQSGEFPYCIARRFNLNPEDLLALNPHVANIPDYQIPAGTVLTIPQSGTFPGSRMLNTHPTTYTVAASDKTIYGVACYYGDIEPAAIAQANGISVSSALTIGQKLNIP